MTRNKWILFWTVEIVFTFITVMLVRSEFIATAIYWAIFQHHAGQQYLQYQAVKAITEKFGPSLAKLEKAMSDLRPRRRKKTPSELRDELVSGVTPEDSKWIRCEKENCNVKYYGPNFPNGCPYCSGELQ